MIISFPSNQKTSNTLFISQSTPPEMVGVDWDYNRLIYIKRLLDFTNVEITHKVVKDRVNKLTDIALEYEYVVIDTPVWLTVYLIDAIKARKTDEVDTPIIKYLNPNNHKKFITFAGGILINC